MLKNIIYQGILLLIIVFLVSLPLIHIPISASSKGIIRSMEENSQLSAVINGRIINTHLARNNQFVKQGDTLLIVTAEQLDTQKQLQNNQSIDYSAQLQDLTKLTRGQYYGLQTGQYQATFLNSSAFPTFSIGYAINGNPSIGSSSDDHWLSF
jgi:HlyD family secretion protein